MNNNHIAIPLRFGVIGLDNLILPGSTQTIDQSNGIWTSAIVGPDGCGKSILALHLASTFWQDNRQASLPPKVVYISTDLSYEQANAQWLSFGLDYPRWREEAVAAAYDNRDRKLDEFRPGSSEKSDRPLELLLVKPIAEEDQNYKSIYKSLMSDSSPSSREEQASPDINSNAIYFFDLQAETAGDDWGFINHLVGLLPQRNTRDPKHLLVVDAVEGLEAFVGEQDAFGQRRDRRSRVAQLIRRATAIGVHLVFIVEEPHVEARLPEQFVTDLVIRLRQERNLSYSQRSIEVEKCRAVAHVRGQHEFAIRRGRGSSTGTLTNLEDPSIPWKTSEGRLIGKLNGDDKFCVNRRKSASDGEQFLANIYIIPSLYYQNRRIRESFTDVPELLGAASFGLAALDQLLKTHKSDSGGDDFSGSISVLLGETGTYKGRLARRYLAQSFQKNQKSDGEVSHCVSVLLSTRFIDQEMLIEKIGRHLNIDVTPEEEYNEWKKMIRERLFCHRFGTRHLTSGAFIDILQRYIREAQKVLMGKGNTPNNNIDNMSINERRKMSCQIRFVLEDWNILLSTYPSLKGDPLLLSTVLSIFRREGISALIVSTQPGQPNAFIGTESHELRNLDEPQILTWTVPFYGDRRVAITAHAIRASERAAMICELGSAPGEGEQLEVSRHFDLYAGIDVGNPHRVPLVVRLYLGNHVPLEDDQSQELFCRLLNDTFYQRFPAPTGLETVKLEPFTEYDRLFTFAGVMDHSHLDHTLVFQIDEFWSVGNHRSLFDLTRYWTSAVAEMSFGENGGKDPIDIRVISNEDQMGIFLPHAQWYEGSNFEIPRISSRDDVFCSGDKKATLYRWCFFVREEDGGQPSCYDKGSQSHGGGKIFRIPYSWDFGIILADRELWRRHGDIRIGKDQDEISVSHIWNRLCTVKNDNFKIGDGDLGITSNAEEAECDRRKVTWGQFLEACRVIGAIEHIPAFDVDMSTVESLSCWLLEMWASIEYDAKPGNLERYNPYFGSLTTHSEDDCGDHVGLNELLEHCGVSLFQALVQMVFTCPHLRSRGRCVYREHVSPHSVASREWYHTASAIIKRSSNSRFVPLRLPGSHSTRGDWHLAVAAGSRSEVLAYSTLDLLSSRRNNLLRLQDGIGLPVRDVLPDINNGDVPTAIVCYDEVLQRNLPLNYRDICALGRQGEDSPISWLWRSKINSYQRDCFYFQRWIARMIEEQHLWFPPSIRSNPSDINAILSPDVSMGNDVQGEAWVQFDRLRKIIRSAVRDSCKSNTIS